MKTSTKLIEAGIGLILFIYVMAALVPGAINTIVNVNSTASGVSNTSAWGTGQQAIWALFAIFVIITVILMFYKHVKD